MFNFAILSYSRKNLADNSFCWKQPRFLGLIHSLHQHEIPNYSVQTSTTEQQENAQHFVCHYLVLFSPCRMNATVFIQQRICTGLPVSQLDVLRRRRRNLSQFPAASKNGQTTQTFTFTHALHSLACLLGFTNVRRSRFGRFIGNFSEQKSRASY